MQKPKLTGIENGSFPDHALDTSHTTVTVDTSRQCEASQRYQLYLRHVDGNFTQNLVAVLLSDSLDLFPHAEKPAVSTPGANTERKRLRLVTYILNLLGNELGKPLLQGLSLGGRSITSSGERGGLADRSKVGQPSVFFSPFGFPPLHGAAIRQTGLT